MVGGENGYDELLSEIKKLRKDFEDLSDKMDAQYRELKRNYRTLNAKVTRLEKSLSQYDYQDIRKYKISVRLPRRTHNSVTDPDYEKDYDFGPRPVYKRR